VPFRDVVQQRGHRRIVELLSRSVSRGTLPPSLVFAGSTESGTREAAVALAQALNCLQRSEADDGDACGRCAACERIARGVHPDVVIVEPGDSGAIKIDQVRDLIERAAYRPFEGRRRVVIIDTADALVTAAQNALLKTLEEPPAASVFVLLTARPDVLLPTVRSRCIKLSFAAGTIAPADEEAREVARRVLAHVATGHDARRIDGAKEILANTGGSAAADREQVKSHLAAMASLLRDMAAISARANDAVLSNADMKSTLERIAPAYQGERGVSAYAAIDTALAAISANVGVKIVADWLVLQL
jgi:DNA polymerase III subunit delta'